jgi:hypothetical protein
MGINTHVYTVYGVKLDWNDDFYEAYEEVEEALLDEFGYNKRAPEDRQIEAIIDCMGGEYMIFGHKIYDSGDFRWCENMNNYQEIDTSNLESMQRMYKEEFKRLYPDHYHLIAHHDFKLINLIHYT